MDHRYSSSSPATASAAKSNHLRNGSMENSNSSSSSESSHRKSFPIMSETRLKHESATQIDSPRLITQAYLEEYTRSNYYDQNLRYPHQRQSSYAQSEGYHSYISSTDSTATPFLDRLRFESQMKAKVTNGSPDFPAQTFRGSNNSISSSAFVSNECLESNSSTETLKCFGSMSDVSVISQATNVSNSSTSSQLIVYSSKVATPQRHNSESILYMNDKLKFNMSADDLSADQFQDNSSRRNKKLFPINTYFERTLPTKSADTSFDPKLPSNCNWQSLVANRINDFEKQQQKQREEVNDFSQQRYTYLDPSKKHRVPNPTLKAFQKNAVKSYFERQQSIRMSKDASNAKSKTGVEDVSKNTKKIPSRPQSLNLSAVSPTVGLPSATSSLGISSPSSHFNWDVERNVANSENNKENHYTSFCEIRSDPYTSPHGEKHFRNGGVPPPLPRKKSDLRRTSSVSGCDRAGQNVSSDLLGAMIVGQTISIDNWVPDRPPKNLSLRIPSPELPPPPTTDQMMFFTGNQDDPLPPPPPEILKQESDVKLNAASRRSSFASPHSDNSKSPISPPAIPMRRSTPVRTSSKLEDHALQIHQKKTVNKRLEIPQRIEHRIEFDQQQTSPSAPTGCTPVRKRAHNSKNAIVHTQAYHTSQHFNQTEMFPNAALNFPPPSDKRMWSHATSPHQSSEHDNSKMHHEFADMKKSYEEQMEKFSVLPDVLPMTVKYRQHNMHHHHHHQQSMHYVSQHSVPNDPFKTPISPVITQSPVTSSPLSLVASSPEHDSLKSVLSAVSESILSSTCNDLKNTLFVDPRLCTRDEVIDKYGQQESEAKLINECDNKIAVVRKLNMVESPEDDFNNASNESFEEKSTSEISEKENFNKTATLQDTPAVPSRQESACQTDEVACESVVESSPQINCSPMKAVSSELNLSNEFVNYLSPSDTLRHIFVPGTLKSSQDYVSELFNINISTRPAKKDASTSTDSRDSGESSASPHLLTPASKPRLHTRYNREMALSNSDSSDLMKKKEELVERLGKKLKILDAERLNINEESAANDALGHDVAGKVSEKVRPFTKFRSYVDDVGYITMLMLSLANRLARLENAMITSNEQANQIILEIKRDRLLEQLDEAKLLKNDIDRRGANLAQLLEKSLTPDEFADYDYFINMKAKLIVDSHEITEKIKLGEEQMNALKDTLVQSEC